MSDEKPKRMRFGLKRWKRSIFWVTVALLVLEFPLTVSFLTLVGISDPDTYRTKLWADGYANGFNSSPDQPLYAAANYQKSVTPLIWSQSLTTFNLVITILSTFIWILKLVLVPMHIMFPVISLLLHSLETGLFAYSVYGQTSHDTIDPEHQNNGLPWYLTHSCSVSAKPSNEHYCQQAKATFYITVFLLALFAVHVLLALHAIFFAPAPGNTDDDTSFIAKRFPKFADGEKTYEYPSTPGTPYTPRTPYSPYTAKGREWELSHMPPTPGTTGGIKSPMGYAPHAGYATDAAAAERERGISMMGFSHGDNGQDMGHGYVPGPPHTVPAALPPVTPRTKAFNALEGGGKSAHGGGAGSSDLRAEWGKRDTGHLPWSGRRSGGSAT